MIKLKYIHYRSFKFSNYKITYTATSYILILRINYRHTVRISLLRELDVDVKLFGDLLHLAAARSHHSAVMLLLDDAIHRHLLLLHSQTKSRLSKLEDPLVHMQHLVTELNQKQVVLCRIA